QLCPGSRFLSPRVLVWARAPPPPPPGGGPASPGGARRGEGRGRRPGRRRPPPRRRGGGARGGRGPGGAWRGARGGDADAPDPAPAATAGEVDVEEDDVGHGLVDDGDGRLDVRRLPDDGEVGCVRLELAAHPAAHEGVVVDDDDPEPGRRVP